MDLSDPLRIEPMELLVPKTEPVDSVFIKTEKNHFVIQGIVKKIKDEFIVKKELIKTEDSLRPFPSTSVSRY